MAVSAAAPGPSWGPAREGDWAWTSPTGSRRPGEDVTACAIRELHEEIGLRACPLPVLIDDVDWAVYALEVPWGIRVAVDGEEHDRLEWVSFAEARRRCRPAELTRVLHDRVPSVGILLTRYLGGLERQPRTCRCAGQWACERASLATCCSPENSAAHRVRPGTPPLPSPQRTAVTAAHIFGEYGPDQPSRSVDGAPLLVGDRLPEAGRSSSPYVINPRLKQCAHCRRSVRERLLSAGPAAASRSGRYGRAPRRRAQLRRRQGAAGRQPRRLAGRAA